MSEKSEIVLGVPLHILEQKDVFIVDYIQKKRLRKGKVEYLVKWKDWPLSDSTWEPAKNIFDYRLIDEFNDRKQNEIKSKKKEEELYEESMKDLIQPFVSPDHLREIKEKTMRTSNESLHEIGKVSLNESEDKQILRFQQSLKLYYNNFSFKKDVNEMIQNQLKLHYPQHSRSKRAEATSDILEKSNKILVEEADDPKTMGKARSDYIPKRLRGNRTNPIEITMKEKNKHVRVNETDSDRELKDYDNGKNEKKSSSINDGNTIYEDNNDDDAK
ncbi:hypothetical protein SNEBB_005812 [Seison nebaliae]|nr:hypothetical protein SNEBB_005812 [Seison nebaliae]